MDNQWLVLALVLLAGGFLVWKLTRKRLPWEAGPTINGVNYSPNAKVVAEPGALCAFDLAKGIDYLTRPAKSIGGSLRIVYEIEAVADTRFIQDGKPDEAPWITPYFQREGDNWSAQGDYQYFRWWAPVRLPLTIGRHDVTVPVNSGWRSVFAKQDPVRMMQAATSIGTVGLCFGGSGGAGHGARSDRPAKFRLISFDGAA